MNELYLNLVLFFLVILLIVSILLLVVLIVGKFSSKVGKYVHFPLTRADSNPLLSPHSLNDWETRAVFNPAAVVDDNGVIHLLYRAIGSDGLSKIGHAESKDGFNFLRKFGFPVYQQEPSLSSEVAVHEKVYNPAQFTSGGGWGGCEDPRAVIIGGRIYMSYTAFNGWHSVRIALTSISVEDFKKGKWNWKRPLMLSAPGTVEKNWVLFPEKFRGRYAILHSISPEVKIDYVSDFDTFAASKKYIRSQNAPTKGGRQGYWDNWMRGAAAPPLKTDKGWLLLYHAMDNNDPNKYKLGAMILDLKNPKKILFRSPLPILSPEMHYENDEKPGVVYASGAVVVDGKLHVYYGGGDKYICAAHADLSSLLDWLTLHGKVK
jgi:beta-1,2-mannobiose phosphorylase / 1,2-beta-oligomannan phosphorylase